MPTIEHFGLSADHLKRSNDFCKVVFHWDSKDGQTLRIQTRIIGLSRQMAKNEIWEKWWNYEKAI
jgi:hypothetical protein